MRKRSTRLFTSLAVTAVLGLTACGGSSEDSNATAATGGASSGPAAATVAYLPLIHTASAVRADAEGDFTDAGIDVTLETVPGGAQAIPSLISGDFDMTYSNYVSAILAASKGLPVRIFAGNDVGGDDHGLFVAADSPIKDVGDLAGRKVAVNALNNIGTVAIKAQVEGAGGDPDAVQFLELPFPDMAAALEKGDVDVIWQVEPFQARATAAGARRLVSLFSGPAAELPVAGWMTTEKYADDNASSVEAFRTGLDTSIEQLSTDPALLQQIVPTYTPVTADVVAKIKPPTFQAEPDVAALQKLADLMEKYGILEEKFDVSTMVVS